MRVTLQTDRECYAPGQPVHLRLDVFNDTDRPVRLAFDSSKKFDFTVLWEDQLIWRWSAERMFAQMRSEETLSPGEQRSFEATWDGRLNNEEVAKPGEYLACGCLWLSGGAEPMADQTLTIAW
jgi:hypothetical protein